MIPRRKPSKKAAAKERAKRREKQAVEGGIRAASIVGRAIIVFLLLVACVIPILFVASPVSYVPLIAVVFMILISFIYLIIVSRSVSFSEDSLLSSCERGTQIEFVVTFKNSSVLPIVRLEPYFFISDLFGEVDTAIPTTMVLMPFEERDFHFAGVFDHIGTYSAGVSKIVISDLVGLFTHVMRNDSHHEVEVLPKIFDVTRLDLSNVTVQESKKAFQPVVADDMDYIGVREYVPGDALKTIHWKLSARNQNGEYFTRLFETHGNPGVSVIVDGTSPEYDSESLMQVFDGTVESALSVCIHARTIGIDATLLYKNRQHETCQARPLNAVDSMPIIEEMPRIRVDEGLEAFEMLTEEAYSIHGEGNIAFCTAHVSDEIVSMLIEVHLHQRNPILFVVVPNTMEREERKIFLRPLRRLEDAQINYYVVSNAAQIEDIGG